MKRKKCLIILSVVTVIVVTVACIVCCSINGFKEDDFELSIKSIQIDGNKVTVTAQLKNKSWRNGFVFSSGLIHISYKDEDGMPDNWGVASIGLINWMSCQQKRTITSEFTLEKGKYTIEANSSFSCNNDKDSFHYNVKKVIELK